MTILLLVATLLSRWESLHQLPQSSLLDRYLRDGLSLVGDLAGLSRTTPMVSLLSKGYVLVTEQFPLRPNLWLDGSVYERWVC